MKKLFFICSLAAALAAGSLLTPAKAQGDNGVKERESHYFVGVQGGVSSTLTNYNLFKLLQPVGSVYVGGYYNSVVGGRLHVSGLDSKGVFPGAGFEGEDLKYKFKYYNADLDLLVNLTNLFCSKKEHFLNLVFVGGVGLNYSWHNKEANCLINTYRLRSLAPEAWTSDRLTHNLRAGLQLEANLSKALAVNIEFDANNMDDRFNSKKSNSDDWRLAAQVGVAYKFGHKSRGAAVPPVTPPAPPVAVEKPATPAPVAPAPKPVPEVKPAPKPVMPMVLSENIFFALAKSDIRKYEQEKIDRIVEFLKNNPEVKATITGHADAGTGNPRINARYAEQRARNVADAIVEGGIDRSRLIVSSKGDTEMPYGDNEKSRVAIVVAQTK